jgi:ribosomal protein S19E (S16A)
MNRQLRYALVQVGAFGPLPDAKKKGDPGLSSTDTNMLKNLGLIKKTKLGWVITPKGEAALKAEK